MTHRLVPVRLSGRRAPLLILAALLLALAPSAATAVSTPRTPASEAWTIAAVAPGTAGDGETFAFQDGDDDETPAEGEASPGETGEGAGGTGDDIDSDDVIEGSEGEAQEGDDNEDAIITLAAILLVVSLVIGAGVGLYGMSER